MRNDEWQSVIYTPKTNKPTCLSKVTLHVFSAMICCIVALMVYSCSGKPTEGDADYEKAKAAADSLYDRMDSLYKEGKLTDCVTVGEILYRRYEALNDTAMMSDVLQSLAIYHQRLGNVSTSMEIVQKVIALDSIKNDPDLLSGDYNIMAALYLTDGNTAEAERFELLAIDYERKTEDQGSLSIRYGILTEIYSREGKFEKAFEYGSEAVKVAQEQGDTAQVGIRLVQLADAYSAGEQYDEAEKRYRQYLDLPAQYQHPVSVAITYKQLGMLYEKTNKIELAKESYEQAVERSRSVNYQLVLCLTLQKLGELNIKDNPSKAIDMLRESREISDTLHSNKVTDMMTSYAARYDKQEKERTILEQAAELRMNRIVIGSLVVLVAISIIAIIIYVYMRRLRRKHVKLEARFSERVVEQTQHVAPQVSPADQEFLDHLASYVDAHLHESELTSAKLADEFCLSQRQFSRRIKQLTGIDTTHYIRASRILRARKLLLNPALAVTDIYVKCGFESLNYFSRTFRQDVGITPTEYRKRGGEVDEN